MRIILFVVFYIVAYVAGITDGRDTVGTMLGNSMRHIFKQKSKIAQSRISEPVDDEIIQKINRHSRQSLLVNQIGGFLQNKKNLSNNLARNLRRKKRRVKNPSKTTRHQNNNIDEKNIPSNVARLQKHSIWQVPESNSMIAVINLNHTTIAQTKVINQSSLTFTKPPSQSKNLDSDRSVNKTILSKYPNLKKLSDKYEFDKNLEFYKIADPKFGNKSHTRPAFIKLNNEILFPFPSPLPSTGISSNFNRSQEFQWRYNEHKKDILSSNKEDSSNYHPINANRRFLLVPISKNLYVLKNVRDKSGIDTDRAISSSNKLAEKNKDNATSAMLSFKAHLHHDVKDIGKAYRRKYFNNYHLTDHSATYSYLDQRRKSIFEENASPAENSMSPSYPNFLYPGVGFQIHPNLIDVASEVSDKQIIHHVPDYENTSPMNDDINFDSEMDTYSFLSSSTSFEMPDYDAASYFKKDTNNRHPVLSAVKLSEINQGNSLKYNEFNVESTTVDFQGTFDTLDYNIDAPITMGLYSTNVDQKVYDVSQNVEEAFELSTKRSKDEYEINFIDFSTQYESNLDESAIKDDTFFSNTTFSFANNDKNILNNQEIIKDSKELIISTPSKDYDEQSTYIDVLNNNKFIDKALFNNYTTRMNFFLNAEDHTMSDVDKWPLKKKQVNVNPRTLLMALKPLSSDLKKLLNAVELVNQSISNVQSRLCDKENIVRSRKIKKGRRKTTNIAKSLNNLQYYNSNLFTENFKNQVSSNRRIKTKDRMIADQIINNVKLKERTNFLFLDKLTTPLYKRESSTKRLKIQNGRRNFLIKKKLNEKKFPKLGDVERRRMSHLRFNRNFRSLTKNYEAQKLKSARQFTKSGFEKMMHAITPILTLSRLVKSNVSSKSNFSNKLSLSTNKSFPNKSTKKKRNQAYFLSNNKRNAAQRNTKRAMEKEMYSSDIGEKFPSVDPQSHKEMTAYQEILGLLDMTKKPRVEHPIRVTWTAQNVTETLLITITEEFFATTTTLLPYFIEEPSITASTIAGQEEATEYEYVTTSDFEYYDKDYAGMYEDFEDKGNVTAWYYMEKTTAMKEIIATGIEETETLIWHTTVEYPFVVSGTLMEMPTMPPLFYTTESTTLSTEEAAILFSGITTEKAITISAIPETETTGTSRIIPTTDKFTTESAMLLTPLLEDMTDITLRTTIPAATKISIKETMAITATLELTQSPLTETGTPLFTIVKTKSTIQVATSTVPVLTSPAITEGPQTATSIGETISATERTITVTMIESTTASSGGRTTLHEAESKITYITRIETEMEDVTPFSTLTVTLATHAPTNATKMAEKITSVAKENKTTSIEPPTTTETIPKELKTVSTLAAINATESSYSSATEALTTTPEISTTAESISADTFAEMFEEPNKTVTFTYVTTVASTPRVTESTIETSTITSEITTESVASTIASSSIISETILSTEAEVTVTQITITQIEKTITAEEITTTAVSTATKTTGTLISTRNLTTIEISTPTKTPTITKTSATTQMSTSGENTTVTKVLTSIETATIAETRVTATGKVPVITTVTRTSTPTNLTAKILTTKPSVKALTAIKPAATTTKIPTITEILTPTNVTTTEIMTTGTLLSTETSTITELSTTTEISTTIESTTITRTLMPTNVTTTEVLTTETLTKTPTITELSTTTEISTTTVKSTITMPMSIEASTINETLTVSETTSKIPKIPTITKIATIIESETYIESSTTITTIEILTPTKTTTETSIVSEISTTSEAPIVTETMITTTLIPIQTTAVTATPTEISTIISTPTITETLIIVETSPIAETIIEIPTIIASSMTTTFATEELTSISITSVFSTTSPATISFKTTVPITSLELTTTTLIANETFPTFFITTKELLIFTTVSPIEMFLTTSSILETATVLSTTAASTIVTEIYESTIITPEITIATPVITDTETTSYETTAIVISTTFSTEITESTTPTSTMSPLETIMEEEATTISTQLVKPTIRKATTATTASETTISSAPEKITATSEKTSPVEITSVTFTTAEETLSMEEITNITFITTIEETSATIFSTERRTTSAMETSTSLTAAITISSTLPEITAETAETSLITTIAVSLSTTEKPEYMTEVTSFTPFFEFTESAFITSQTPATTLEVISTLPETEEFATESPIYTESSTILFTEAPPVISTFVASSSEEIPEAETEYYIAREPQYEEYEDYEKEIPTDEWFDYEEYEATTRERILSTVKYTKPEEEAASPFVEKVTTVSVYGTKIFKFTTYSTSASTYTSSISSTSYIEEEFTSILKTPIVANATTTSEAETEYTTSTASKVEKSTTGPTFGSTEEYSLPSSTVFEITTKPLPLEYPTVSPEHTESTESTLESSAETTRNFTLPKFVTKPKEIPKIERTTTSERILTETRVTAETSFFVSSVLTTLSKEEITVEVRATTVSPTFSETTIETGYEIATTAMLITKDEYVTPFVASETEFEFTTTSDTVEQRDQLLQQLDRLKEHEREIIEKEERLKERERQWEREKEKRLQMMREKGKNITSTISSYITTALTNLTLSTISTENLTTSTTAEIEMSSVLATISLPEIITISIPFYSTEVIIPVTYTAEMMERITTEESITYVTTEIEELIVGVPYTAERSTYITEEPQKTRVTDYIIFTPRITTPIIDLYKISTSSVESSTPYSVEGTYVTSYGTVYVSEPSLASPTLLFTNTTILTSSAALAVSTTEYEEIERLKEELRKRERELKERERILLEREKKLERDILEFEKYMKEFEKEIIDRSSIVPTSFSTPVPPIEKTTAKLEVTTLAITEMKENRTTKMVTTRYETTKVKGIEENATTSVGEEKIVTKRICLNVLANTTIPLDKVRRGIVTKKICLPYFPEKNEKDKSVGRLSRKPLAFREFSEPKRLSDFRFRKKREREERVTTRQISNLQLSHHEWLSNEPAKPLQHFKGFTRIYQKIRKPSLRNVAIIDAQEDAIDNFYNKTSLYERRVLDHYENFFQSTTKSTLYGEKYEQRNIFFKRQKFFNNDKAKVKKRDVSTTKKNIRFLSTKNTANISSEKATTAIAEKEELNNDEDEFYTVNVVQLGYNKNEETHEVISAKPDKNDLTVIKITTPYYELENEADLKEKNDEETERKIQEENDDIDDMVENYMNYEERETSTLTYDTKFLNKSKNKRITENKAELLDRIWPTEKITSYHLGGTRFWELDFEVVTESSVSSVATDKSETIDLVSKTTCFHVILKNKRHNDSEMKSNIHHHKRHTYNNKINKYNTDKKDTSLNNVTRNSALRNKLKTKWPGAIVKELRYNLHNLRGSNHHKQSSERKRMVKPGEFPLSATGNESSIISRSRKLCGVKEKKKQKTIQHKDAANIKNIKNKNKNKSKLAKSKNVTSHSRKNCADNCITNKKNPDKRHKTTIAETTANHNFHVKKSVAAHPNVIDNQENKSISHERKLHDCLNCICDLTSVINDIKSTLDKTSFSFDEIKALNCSKYKETQDKMVISMNSDTEEAKEFSQPHYNTEFLKGQKYIKLEELEDDFKSDSELDNDHDIISLPGLNLNLPCNQDSDGITWLSSISRPSYTWKRTDGIALFGFVAENGDLELRNVNAKDTGNYTCVITYTGPDNEEPVETTYEVHLQVVTLPRYILYGENRYHIRSCDERDMEVLVMYLPLKLNSVICEEDFCNAYVLPPSCTRNQITINILIVPSHIVKLMTVDPKHCNVLCLKAIQDKLSLILSRNLQIFLEKTIIFRLPYYEQRLVPITEKASFARWKRGRMGANTFGGKSSNIGVFSSCPAGYGLLGTRCVPCDMGTYSEDGISHCKKCPPGTYQPNHGARVCRTCTNPLTKGCYNMLWNSFSAVMVTLASFSVMLSIFLLLLWIICCAKKKFCVKKLASIVPKEGILEQEKHLEEQPLIKDVSENEDQQWDSEYRIKKKKGKFYINKRRRKQNDRKKHEKIHAPEDEWGSHRIKNVPIICPDSYRSHEDYNNYYPKQSYRQGPRLPECDFDT